MRFNCRPVGLDFIEGAAQQTQERLARFSVTRSAQDVKSAEQQQAFIIRQFLAFRSPQQDAAQCRRGFLDSQRAHPDSEGRQLLFRCDGLKVIFDRTDIRRVLGIAEDCLEFLLFHAALPWRVRDDANASRSRAATRKSPRSASLRMPCLTPT